MNYTFEPATQVLLLPELQPLAALMPSALPERDFRLWLQAQPRQLALLPKQVWAGERYARLGNPFHCAQCHESFRVAMIYNLCSLGRSLALLALTQPLKDTDWALLPELFGVLDEAIDLLEEDLFSMEIGVNTLRDLHRTCTDILTSYQPALCEWSNFDLTEIRDSWKYGWFPSAAFEQLLLLHQNQGLSTESLPPAEEAAKTLARVSLTRLGTSLTHFLINPETGENSVFAFGLLNPATREREFKWQCLWTEEPVLRLAPRADVYPAP